MVKGAPDSPKQMLALWWWIDRWRKSTAYTDMTLEEQGAYRNLLDEATLRGGALPNIELTLAKASGDATRWKKVRPAVMARFELRDGVYRNATLDEVLKESKRRADKQRAWRNSKRNDPGNGGGNGSGNNPGSPSPDQDPSPDNGTDNERPFSQSEEQPPGHGIAEEHRKAYAAEVWVEFLKVSGQRRLGASPSEFITLKAWMDAGIPLRIVLRGMADTKGVKAATLSYYGPSVREAYESWRQAIPQ